MGSAEADCTTGVFSPEISKRGPLNQIHHGKEHDKTESDGSNVFSPDVLRSRLIKSSSSSSDEENTPPATETRVTKQLEDFGRKNVRRKRYFCDALNTQNLDDDSCNQSAEEDSLDNLEKQVSNEKRAKRFRLSFEVPLNDSNSDYTGIGSSASQEENQNKRKKRFVVSSTQENDNSTYSDVFRSASQGENIKRKSRFVVSSTQENDNSTYSDVFKSASRGENIKRKSRFVAPPSFMESDDNSGHYSERNVLEPYTSALASVQKISEERVPSTSAALNDIPSRNFTEISTQTGSYSLRSRSSSSSQTFGSKSSVSVFSISKIGRRSSAPKVFKVPQVPKIAPKKKKRCDSSFKHLPSRPNFPKFDFYCNKRFYDYLTSKMEPKYGIRTNNKAVELAKYITEVVKEVIAMKTGRHHILIEEMKKVLFKAGIVTTHFNFYMFCFDYLPPWFRRKAIPMYRPLNYPPNVEFDTAIVFHSID